MQRFFLLLLFSGLIVDASSQTNQGILHGRVLLNNSSSLLSCNVTLTDTTGRNFWPDSTYFWKSFMGQVYPEFPSNGTFTIPLPYGKYSYSINRGPEYKPVSGKILVNQPEVRLEVSLEQMVNMKKRNWWSGDMHIHRKVALIPALMAATDLHIAPVITSWNENLSPYKTDTLLGVNKFDGDRFYTVSAAEDERTGGAVLFLNLSKPVNFGVPEGEYPSLVSSVYRVTKEEPNAWIDIEKPFWWDLPFFLATGKVNSIGIAHNHMHKEGIMDNEAWGRGRDVLKYPPVNGNGYWTQELYYRVLNSGFRIPPSAGSASGVLPNPVGYNRAYAYVENGLTYEKWWKAAKEGKLFISNGPMLLCKANGQLPGHVFTSEGKKLKIAIHAELYSNDTIASVEIIRNGKVYASIDPVNIKGNTIQTSVQFEKSGWFLVRVVCKTYNTFRFASTAPFYVEIGGDKKFISKPAVEFFLDWSKTRVSKIKWDNPDQRDELMKQAGEGVKFWEELLGRATTEE